MKSLNCILNRALYGDCIAVLREFPAACVDLVVTDPPYLVNYRSREGRTYANDDNSLWLKPAFAQIYRVLKPDKFCVCCYGWPKAERFLHAWKENGLFPVGHFVFVKRYASKTGFTASYHEQAYLLAKGHPPKPERPIKDVIAYEFTGNPLHPTQKPVSAIVPFIEAFSQANEIVLDPFAGSGTTAVAAWQSKRRFIVIEKVWRYCRAARERLNALTGDFKSTTFSVKTEGPPAVAQA